MSRLASFKAAPRLRLSNYLNGAAKPDPRAATYELRYAGDNSVYADVEIASPSLVDEAFELAANAQREWAATPALERGRVLCEASRILNENSENVSILECVDTGRPLQETLAVDVVSARDCLDYVGGTAPGLLNGEHIETYGSFNITSKEPLGVCVGIGAYNYPLQSAAWKSAPCLAAGNAMIFKPADDTPQSALSLAEAYTKAGLPHGLFQVLLGPGADVGARLVSDRRTKKISFTGSLETAKNIQRAVCDDLKKISLELGGKSPLLIFDDVESVHEAVSIAMLANFYSAGQVCSNGTRVFVHTAIKDEFLRILKERTGKMRIGDPLDENVQIGPVVHQAQRKKVSEYMDLGLQEGAKLLCGGGMPVVDYNNQRLVNNECYVEPTVFYDCDDSMRIVREEIFGPVMTVLDFDDEEDVVARANDTEFGLAAGVCTADIKKAHRVTRKLNAGQVWINHYNLAPAEVPWGGYKLSGVGRENGTVGINNWVQIKTTHVELGSAENDCPYE